MLDPGVAHALWFKENLEFFGDLLVFWNIGMLQASVVIAFFEEIGMNGVSVRFL